MGYIYKITNSINDRLYIGQTQNTIAERWKGHKKSAVNSTAPLYLAMRKYGVENFSIQVIEECDDELLNEREIYWIEYYDSYHNGYNATMGGQGVIKHSRKAILELWEQGYTEREISTIMNCTASVVVSALDVNNIPREDRVKRSAVVRRQKNGTKIGQYSLEGDYLATYISSGDAEVHTGISQDEINRCCVMAQRERYGIIYYTSSAGGYIWKREEDTTPISKWVELNRKKGGRKAVAQYDLEGNYIQSFLSQSAAAEAIGHTGSGNQIGLVCSGKRKTAYGYKWKYITDEKEKEN